MSKKARKTGPASLAELQNLVKRDKEAYVEEFRQQQRRYNASLEIFRLNPQSASEEFGELVMFLSHVSHCYPNDLKGFPNELVELLDKHAEALNADLRQTLCRALILLRNKDMLTSSALLQLFFRLFKCADKALRQTLYKHIVNDIRRLNAKHKNNAVNKTLQNFMFTMLSDPNAIAARKSLDAMIELHDRKIWNDTKTINVIASATLLPTSKISAAAVRFFLRTNEEVAAAGDDHDPDDEEELTQNIKQMTQANIWNKKSAKRKNKLEKVKRALRKTEAKSTQPQFHFAALHAINDPQGLAEKLFAKLRAAKQDRFEIRLLYMNLISRLIGVHELFLFNFYPFLQRYIQTYQADVTKVLTFIAQAAHPLVPSETLESVLMTIANNFITEKSSAEAMAVGINSIREICSRCPLAMTQDLLEDLIQYKSSKFKSVVMAARSLIQLFRDVNPQLLPKKERGKPGEKHDETAELLEYGAQKPNEFVPGTELLTLYDEAKEAGEIIEEEGNDGWETASDESGDEADWVTVTHDDDGSSAAKKSKKSAADEEDKQFVRDDVVRDTMTKEERLERAKTMSAGMFLSQEDFERMDAIKSKKMLAPAVSARETREHEEILDELAVLPTTRKTKQSKDERLAHVKEGREDRGKFGVRKGRQNEHASTTNKEKARKKPIMMKKYSREYRAKGKQDLRTRKQNAEKSKKRDQRNRK